jgi:hypothetical protein
VLGSIVSLLNTMKISSVCACMLVAALHIVIEKLGISKVYRRVLGVWSLSRSQVEIGACVFTCTRGYLSRCERQKLLCIVCTLAVCFRSRLDGNGGY